MKSIDVSAATIEEAISSGLVKLGCSISDCKVQVLQEGAKGLFGLFGSKPATVRLTLLHDADEEKNDFVDFTISLRDTMDASENVRPAAKKKSVSERCSVPEPRPAEKKSAAEQPAPEASKPQPALVPEASKTAKNSDVFERFKNAPLPGVPAKEEEDEGPSYVFRPATARPPRTQTQSRTLRRENREPRAPRAEAPVRKPMPEPENIVIHDASTMEGEVQQFLLELTQKMNLDVRVDVHTNEESHVFANIYGDALGILIGRRGETLDALQYLTSLRLNRGREGYTRVTLDTENYRAKREDALTRLASRMANRAIKTGRKVALEPMNPYERRILHASLQNNQQVSTHSEGDEPYRHVVIVPNK